MMSDQKKAMYDKSDDTKSVLGEAGKVPQWPVPPVGKVFRRFKLVPQEEVEKEIENARHGR